MSLLSKHNVQRLAILLLPLALTPLWLYGIAYGHLSLGGGDKDILLLGPWLLWSLLFICAGGVVWRRHAVMLTWLLRSVFWSVLAMLLAWGGLLLFVYSRVN